MKNLKNNLKLRKKRILKDFWLSFKETKILRSKIWLLKRKHRMTLMKISPINLELKRKSTIHFLMNWFNWKRIWNSLWKKWKLPKRKLILKMKRKLNWMIKLKPNKKKSILDWKLFKKLEKSTFLKKRRIENSKKQMQPLRLNWISSSRNTITLQMPSNFRSKILSS